MLRYKVVKERKRAPMVYFNDGRKMTLKKFAEWADLPYTAVAASYRYHKKSFQKNIEGKIFRKRYKIKPKGRVYFRDGEYLCIEQVMEKTNVVATTAHTRLRRWERGEYTKEKVFEINRVKKPKKSKRQYHQSYLQQQKALAEMVKGLQPRKTVHELRPLGTWEQRMLERGAI